MGFHLEDTDGEKIEFGQSGSTVVFCFDFENHGLKPNDATSFSLGVLTNREQPIFHYYSDFSDVYFKDVPKKGVFKCTIPHLPLAPGNYLIGVRCVINGSMSNGEEVDWPRIYIPMNVQTGDFFNIGSSNISQWGPVLVKGEWTMEGRP